MSVTSPHWSAGTPIPPPPSKIGHISQAAKARNCASANIIHNTWLKACCTILCISSWTSSTHRRLGSSSRRICLLTKSSNEISGTNKAGRGPCEQKKKKNSDLREIHILVISSNCDLISYRCVSNGRQYIFCGKSLQGIHVLKCLTKDVVKNVTYPRSSTTVLVNKTKIKLDSFSLGLFI